MVDVNIDIKVPALEKLVDYTASGIGAVAGPMLAPWKAEQNAKAKRIEAKAEADSTQIIAEAQAEARQSLVQSDEVGRGTLKIDSDGIAQRVEFQERKRQANIVSVTRDAAVDLGDKQVPDHTPDPDWTARFFGCVQDVSSEDMRKMWAKILSGEVESPGRTSLRTLDILKNMTMQDARMFKDMCDFVINDEFIFYPIEYRINHPVLAYDKMVHLQSLGLLHMSALLSKVVMFNNENNHNAYFVYGNSVLRISVKNNQKKIDIPEILLTSAGRELHKVDEVECKFRMDYMQSFFSFLRGKNCELSRARLIEKHPDRQIRHGPFVAIEPELEQPAGTAHDC